VCGLRGFSAGVEHGGHHVVPHILCTAAKTISGHTRRQNLSFIVFSGGVPVRRMLNKMVNTVFNILDSHSLGVLHRTHTTNKTALHLLGSRLHGG